MDNKNRFSAVFGSIKGLLVSIFLFLCIVLRIVVGVMQISEDNDRLFGRGLYVAEDIILMSVGVILLALVAVGFLISFLKGRKGEISTAGLMLIRVNNWIVNIFIFVCYVICAIGLGICFIAAGSNYDMWQFILIGILSFIIFGGCAALFLIKALKVNGILKTIRWYEKTHKKIKAGFLYFAFIITILGSFLILLINIFKFVARGVIQNVADMCSYLGEFGEIIVNFLFGTSNNATVQWIINIVLAAITIAMYVIIIIMIAQAKKIDMNSIHETVSEPELEPIDVHDEPITDILSDTSGSIIQCFGNAAGGVYPIDESTGELIMGKDAREAHIIVESWHKSVSRKHCGIRYVPTAIEPYEVIDYSTNGTYVVEGNGKRRMVKNVYTRLPKGSIIRLGKEDIRFKLD